MADFPVTLSDSENVIHFTLKNSDDTQLMIAAWLDVPLADEFTEKSVGITLEGITIKEARAVDLFNGTEQRLDIVTENGKTLLEGIHIKDYPLLVYFII